MRLVLVSNRLPVVIEQEGDAWRCRPGSGGLVTALNPVLRRHGGVWIGWPGVADQSLGVFKVLASQAHTLGFQLEPVWLTPEEQQGFYHGFSNEVIWPLFHDLQSRCNFVPEYWTSYQAVNEKFAGVVARCAGPEDFIWVQDYHLMELGPHLRRRGLGNRLGFFLHIPFPPPDIFCKLPWRGAVLDGLSSYDVVGFQTPHDRDNFADSARSLRPKRRLRRGRGGWWAEAGDRTTRLIVCPIGIDYDEFAVRAAQEEVAARARALRSEMQSEQIVLGLDRLDYTKGIVYRLRAFQLALQNWPALHRRVTLVQVVIPSRESVPEYQDLKAEIERLVAQINGQFTQPGWVPIHYVFRSLDREELLAYYRAADVALVTPLKDGMNLIAKEFCACQVESDGVLILSEFAGAAIQLRRDALLVNPYDLDGVAEAIRRAALMTRAERRPAMRRLRGAVRRQNVHWWAERFLAACELPLDRRGEPHEPQGPASTARAPAADALGAISP